MTLLTPLTNFASHPKTCRDLVEQLSMLRCQPTIVGLTKVDIERFAERLAEKHNLAMSTTKTQYPTHDDVTISFAGAGTESTYRRAGDLDALPDGAPGIDTNVSSARSETVNIGEQHSTSRVETGQLITRRTGSEHHVVTIELSPFRIGSDSTVLLPRVLLTSPTRTRLGSDLPIIPELIHHDENPAPNLSNVSRPLSRSIESTRDRGRSIADGLHHNSSSTETVGDSVGSTSSQSMGSNSDLDLKPLLDRTKTERKIKSRLPPLIPRRVSSRIHSSEIQACEAKAANGSGEVATDDRCASSTTEPQKLWSRMRHATISTLVSRHSASNLSRTASSASYPLVGSSTESSPIESRPAQLKRKEISTVDIANCLERANFLGSADSRCRTLEATEEFLSNRSSPLCELEEKLSRLRLSTSLGLDGQATTHMSSSSTRSRPLLSGRPFDIDSSDESDNDFAPERHISKSPTQDSVLFHVDSGQISPIIASSRSVMQFGGDISNRIVQPSTPPAKRLEDAHSPSTGHSSGITRKVRHPIATITQSAKNVKARMRTPKVHVYDDAKSPAKQPQTPADLVSCTPSAQRGKAVGASTVENSKQIFGVTDHSLRVTSPANLPSRYHRNRHTYPTITTAGSVGHQHRSQHNPARAESALQATRATPHRSVMVRERRTNAEHEDTLEHADLLSDHMAWVSRQGRGNLDVTPPREGRFERLLR